MTTQNNRREKYGTASVLLIAIGCIMLILGLIIYISSLTNDEPTTMTTILPLILMGSSQVPLVAGAIMSFMYAM